MLRSSLLSSSSNTGYGNICLTTAGDNVVVTLNMAGKKSGDKRIGKSYNLTKKYTYADAIKIALLMKCEVLGIPMPRTLALEKGLRRLHYNIKGHQDVKVKNPLPRNDSDMEIPTVVLLRETNMVCITENLTSYRVNIRPDNNSDDTGRSFKFLPTDNYTKQRALEEAIIYRDSMYIINKSNNTGYKGIKVTAYKNTVSVTTNITVKGRPYTKQYDLGKKMSYREALNGSLDLVCSLLNIKKSKIIKYDYGLSTAYEFGYAGHKDDDVIVSNQIKTGMEILDPKTGEIGVVRSVVDDVTLLAEFKTGKSFRVIVNEVLANNLLSQHIVVIEDMSKAIEANVEVAEHIKLEEIKTVHSLDHNVHKMYSQTNDNKVLPDDIKEAKEIIATKKIRRLGGIKIISKKTGHAQIEH